MLALGGAFLRIAAFARSLAVIYRILFGFVAFKIFRLYSFCPVAVRFMEYLAVL